MGNVQTLFYNGPAWQQGYLTPWTSAHPLLSAAESGDATVVEQMLAEDGVDVNVRNGRGDEEERSRKMRRKEEESCEDDEAILAAILAETSLQVKKLLTAEIPEEDDYDSDIDPPFIPPAIPDPDLDYDEYSDGEIPEGELICAV